MSNASSLISQTNKADKPTEYLIFGYIRNIGYMIVDQIIPIEIIELCIEYYLSTSNIIYIKQQGSKDYPQIHIAQLDTDKYYECRITKFEKDISLENKSKHRIANGAVRYIHNFKIAPNIISKYDELKQELYDIIFTFGGSDANKDCNAYIIDPKQYNINISSINNEIKAYYLALPNLLNEVFGSCAIYSKKYGLCQIGAVSKNSFNVLSLESDTLKWEKHAMLTSRAYVAATMIDENKLFCCGGYQGHYSNCTEIYDFTTREWSGIADKKVKTCRAGIYFNKNINDRVYVGGGKNTGDSKGALKIFEYYDLRLNKWFMLPEMNAAHGADPIIWMDNCNIIYIASSYAHCMEKIDLRENKWDILMESKDFFDFIHAEPRLKAFDHRLCVSV